MNVGVIDIGSNTIKLLVANEAGAVFKDVYEVRLFSKDKFIEDAVLATAVEAVDNLVEAAKQFRCTKIEVVATSAIREAENREAVVAAINKQIGQAVTILSGEDEARLIAEGIMNDPTISDTKEFLAVDIGGGSLECIYCVDGMIKKAVSLPLGAVRVMNQFVKDVNLPLDVETQLAIKHHVYAELEKASIVISPETLIVAGGGAISVAKLILGGEEREITLEDLTKLHKRICMMALRQRSQVPHLPLSRADIMPAGLSVVLSLLNYYNKHSFLHSYHNLRFGIAQKLLTQGA